MDLVNSNYLLGLKDYTGPDGVSAASNISVMGSFLVSPFTGQAVTNYKSVVGDTVATEVWGPQRNALMTNTTYGNFKNKLLQAAFTGRLALPIDPNALYIAYIDANTEYFDYNTFGDIWDTRGICMDTTNGANWVSTTRTVDTLTDPPNGRMVTCGWQEWGPSGWTGSSNLNFIMVPIISSRKTCSVSSDGQQVASLCSPFGMAGNVLAATANGWDYDTLVCCISPLS